jgi:hypothetical protein
VIPRLFCANTNVDSFLHRAYSPLRYDEYNSVVSGVVVLVLSTVYREIDMHAIENRYITLRSLTA